MKGKMEGKVALVTGGGGGFGRSTALAFAQKGAKVIVVDVFEEGGKETIHLVKIKNAVGDAIFLKCDVSKAAEVEAMVNKGVETYGRLDYAFNNAGMEGLIIPIADYPEDHWNQVISVNLTGVWLCMKYEIPQMLKQGRGAIVNTSSAAGLIGAPPGSTAYTASKHGVVGLTKTVALEYAKAGIRVNAVCPGAFYTPMLDRMLKNYPDLEKFCQEVHPMGRLGNPEELAMTVVWLCLEPSFITGVAIPVDGGLTAQ